MPFLLLGGNAMLRRPLAQWFAAQDIRPQIVGEVDDPALVQVLGEAGLGVFAVPSVVEEDVRQRYQVQLVGRAESFAAAFLRHLGRAEDPPPRGHGHLRGGAAGYFRVTGRRAGAFKQEPTVLNSFYVTNSYLEA